jgi:hypothetical protein
MASSKQEAEDLAS